MRCAPTFAVTLLVLTALGACGDVGESPSTQAPTGTTPASSAPEAPAHSPACRALSRAKVGRVIAAAGGARQQIERSPNDSLDLSICEHRERAGPELYIKITIDSAPNTARRYYNLIAEGRQRATFDAIPDSSKPHGVRGVGNDHTHGGVGAYWVPLTNLLTAIEDGRIVKVGFHVDGVGDGRSREAAANLASAVLARGRGA